MPQNIELRRRRAAAEAAKLVFNISIKTPLESVVRVVFLSKGKVSDFNLDLTSVGRVGECSAMWDGVDFQCDVQKLAAVQLISAVQWGK